jgi:hypothetical protein
VCVCVNTNTSTHKQSFPLCYGYWDKLARLEQTAGGRSAAASVYERGLKAVKCWELYLKYANHAVRQCGPPEALGDNAPQDAREQSANEKIARDIFARAAAEVGAVWDSAKLWEAWLAFEEARPKDVLIHGKPQPLHARVAAIALRAASSPMKPETSARFYELFSKTLSEGDARHIAQGVLACLPPSEQV